MTTGTMLLMWLGEQITERGIGNGVSLVITIGILARLPQAVHGSDGHVLPGRRRRADVSTLRHGRHAVDVAGGGDRRRHCHHPGAAENSGAIRPARGRAQDVCRRHVVHAAARELFRRHADHFRAVHPDVSAADLPVACANHQGAVPAGHFPVAGDAAELRLVSVYRRFTR